MGAVSETLSRIHDYFLLSVYNDPEVRVSRDAFPREQSEWRHDHSAQMAAMVDLSGTILHINLAASSYLGYVPSQLIRKSIDCLLPRLLQARHNEAK